jgi:hypothetical protein
LAQSPALSQTLSQLDEVQTSTLRAAPTMDIRFHGALLSLARENPRQLFHFNSYR